MGGLGLQGVVINGVQNVVIKDEGGSVTRVWGRGDNLSVLQSSDQALATSSDS